MTSVFTPEQIEVILEDRPNVFMTRMANFLRQYATGIRESAKMIRADEDLCSNHLNFASGRQSDFDLGQMLDDILVNVARLEEVIDVEVRYANSKRYYPD
jgi:hypothetical protein